MPRVLINNDLVTAIGAGIMGPFIAGSRDLGAIDDAHLDALADVAVRAAMAISAAIPRAQDRLNAEAEAAAKAEADEKAAEDRVRSDVIGNYGVKAPATKVAPAP